MRILLVDDDLDLIWLCRVALTSDGHEILAATDARSGLSLAFQELPDLIVLDIMLPDKDGYAFLADLRSNRSTRETPVVVLTVKSRLEDEVRGSELGADLFLTKPFSPLVLCRAVKAIRETSVTDRLARRAQRHRNLNATGQRLLY
jgi:DNA-binding response OmpR family regulator